MSVEIRAILVSRDPDSIGVFADRFKGLGVITEVIKDLTEAKERLLQSKVEAIVVDFDTLNGSHEPFELLRGDRSNRGSVLIAIATGPKSNQLAIRQGARFILKRPLVFDEVSQTIQSTYALMLQERRKYFRVTAVLDVWVWQSSGTKFQCTTINLARNGMAINAPVPLETGESLKLIFPTPGSESLVCAQATVVWDDRHGKTGLRFECINEQSEKQLHTWLDDQYLAHLQQP